MSDGAHIFGEHLDIDTGKFVFVFKWLVRDNADREAICWAEDERSAASYARIMKWGKVKVTALLMR
ncbi:MAG: hypothetical protein IID41_14430 [Planctomycetes bacterium]|nr:hypothetical protein [Planctomycetota bacterium]